MECRECDRDIDERIGECRWTDCHPSTLCCRADISNATEKGHDSDCGGDPQAGWLVCPTCRRIWTYRAGSTPRRTEEFERLPDGQTAKIRRRVEDALRKNPNGVIRVAALLGVSLAE